jgi:hypothetical protein
MPQIIRPDGVVSSNVWTPTPVWQQIDEASPDDDTTKVTASHIGSGSTNAKFRVTLSNPNNPPDPNGAHSFVYRINHISFLNQGALTLTARLYDGVTLIASQQSVVFIDDVYDDKTRVLTSGERAAITSHNNLEFELEAAMSGAAPPEQVEIRCTQVYMSVPDPATRIGTASVSMPRLTATGAGTNTSPVRTGDAIVTVPEVTADGVGSYIVPIAGDVSMTVVELDATGDGANLGIGPVQGDSIVDVPELTAAGVGSHIPQIDGTGEGVLTVVTIGGRAVLTGVWVKDLPKPGTWT